MPNIQYFLGANSPQGFYSLYDQLISPEAARSVYILKGGPGCGKSTLMRRVGARAEQAGLEPEYILCSGDPDSLDAVVLPQLGAALVDGTAPHVVEPTLPGVVDTYVDLGACYDRAALAPLRQAVTDSMKGYKGCYQRVYRCLGAAGRLAEDERAILLTDSCRQRLAKRAQGILSREVPKQKGAQPGRVRQRFLTGVTHKGLLSLTDTARALCPRIYELTDPHGLSHDLLNALLTGIIAAGHDAVACPDPMDPRHLEHLLVPGLGLAFLTSGPEHPLPGRAYRRIHVDTMADPDLLRGSRARLRFARKVRRSLVEEAVDSLAQAKAMHDELEAIYNPHVDFDRVEQTAQEICGELGI